MATGAQPHAEMTAGAQLLLEKKAAGVMLRPVRKPEFSKELSGSPSQVSDRGSAGAAAADFSFPGHGYPGGVAAGREPVGMQDGLGAMRGFVFVIGMYLVMGAMALTGLMIWHWLR